MTNWFTAWQKSAAMLADMGQASFITVGHRLPMLAVTPFFPTPELLLEANRMVTEKMVAAWEGALAASTAAARLTSQAAGGKASLGDLAAGGLEIATAAAAPARRKARANARRLTRRTRKK